METVGAVLGGDKDGGSRAAAVLRGVIVGEDFKFLDVVDGGKGADTAGGQFVVVHAVEEPIGAIRAGAADGQGERTTGGDLAGRGAGIEKTAGIGLGSGAGGEGGELHEVSSVQRQLGDFLRSDNLAEGGIGGFNGDGGGGDFHGGGLRGGRQGEIELAGFVDLQAQVFGDSRLKTGEVDLDSIDAYGEQREQVVASLVGLGSTLHASGLRRSGDGGAGLIDDRAGEAANGLAVHRGGAQKRGKNGYDDCTTERSYPHEKNSFRVPRAAICLELRRACLTHAWFPWKIMLEKIVLRESES